MSKFVYDLTSKNNPKPEELDKELDHLLLRSGPAEATYVHEYDYRNPSDQIDKLDSEIISNWLRFRLEPAMLILTVKSDENIQVTKGELSTLPEYRSLVDRMFRFKFLENHATNKIRELISDVVSQFESQVEIKKTERTLTFLSNHLQNCHNLTLLNTEKYTSADLALINYLRRILTGKYNTFGLRIHVKNCDPLMNFMKRFKSKNPYVVIEDPASDEPESRNLLGDLTAPAIFALGSVLFFLWRLR